MEREQQEEMQAQAWAVMVMQGGGMPGPLTACEKCTVHLQEPEGCVVSERGKARVCLPCQKARWKASAEAREEEGREDCNEHVAQRWGEAQEGVHDDGGGRG